MVRVAEVDAQAKANRGFVVLSVLAAVATIFSIYVINGITHNFYTAGYYTFTALFDASGIDANGNLSSLVTPFSEQFYIVVGVSVLDGLIKIAIIGFIIAAIINTITSLDLRSRFGIIGKNKLKNHVIVCGYSTLAEKLCAELTEKKVPFVVVERNPSKVDTIREAGHTVIHDDFASDTALQNASISTAKAIAFLTGNDYENLLGVVTAHHVNSKIKIISRAENDLSVSKMHRAGTELCLVPEVLAGIEIGNSITSRMSKK